ncbi:MAG: cytochrome c [Zetaproteobacteria bacterium]|nr:MAG: cytochrome c [Zetaproteobacteria bacterium]
MKRGERFIAGAVALVVVVALGKALLFPPESPKERDSIPFYSTADHDLQVRAADLYRRLGCRDCHSLWGVRNITRFVPAPALDGIGSWRSEEWLYRYFSSRNPQRMLPSRLKPKYRMPSYAHLPKEQRRLLARYFASLKVKDWYLKQARAAEYEKLTGRKPPEEGKAAEPEH